MPENNLHQIELELLMQYMRFFLAINSIVQILDEIVIQMINWQSENTYVYLNGKDSFT